MGGARKIDTRSSSLLSPEVPEGACSGVEREGVADRNTVFKRDKTVGKAYNSTGSSVGVADGTTLTVTPDRRSQSGSAGSPMTRNVDKADSG